MQSHMKSNEIPDECYLDLILLITTVVPLFYTTLYFKTTLDYKTA